MKRRNFLKVFASAGAAIALPVAGLGAREVIPPPGSRAFGDLTETIVKREDLEGEPWVIVHQGVFGDKEAYVCQLCDFDPSGDQLRMLRQNALKGFKRYIKRKLGRGPEYTWLSA